MREKEKEREKKALVCLLACTSNFIQGCKYDITLQEIIKTLNNLTDGKGKNSCMELTVADAFAGPKNTDGKEICRAAKVLQQLYKRHDRSLIKECLSGLDRNLKGMANGTGHSGLWMETPNNRPLSLPRERENMNGRRHI
ncbi:interleukin-4 isoform X2 [Equus asinus]|uniref:interleukin-4 isoform X2 n=1 Tax=Equus asinus TaxID=9793 RepID=UPI0038F5DE85